MLTPEQVDHYRTFGYVVLRQYLAKHETAALAAEIDDAHRDAFGALLAERPMDGGIPGHYLPMMSRRHTPRSLALVEDARFLDAARDLAGGPDRRQVLPIPAEGILYFADTPLHNDAGPGVSAVKFVTYLEPLTASTGALRVLPGSHHPQFTAALDRWRRQHRAQDDEAVRRQVIELPLQVLPTNPGDVIAFDWHTWHASVGGRDRRQWTVSYVADPVTDDDVARFTDIVLDTGLELVDDDPGYDTTAYPPYDEHWLTPTPASSVRAALSHRMRQLGMFRTVEQQHRRQLSPS